MLLNFMCVHPAIIQARPLRDVQDVEKRGMLGLIPPSNLFRFKKNSRLKQLLRFKMSEGALAHTPTQLSTRLTQA